MSLVIEIYLFVLMAGCAITAGLMSYFKVHSRRVKETAERCEIKMDITTKCYWCFLGVMTLIAIILLFFVFY